jgi:hypothetical protein
MVALLIALALSNTAYAAKPHSKRAVRCTTNLRALKVWADPQRFRVYAPPVTADLTYVNNYRRPRGTQPKTRITYWQRQVWAIKVQIVEYHLERGEIRMVLFWDNKYMNAVLPTPPCLLRKTRQRANIVKTWSFFTRRCGTPTGIWQPLGAVVVIKGVGFWESKTIRHRGEAINGAELHPVTGISVIAGCGT